MKRFICALCAFVIGIIGITGCNPSANNPFTSEKAIKGQLGELYYVVPENAILLDSSISEELAMYSVPIDNSAEKYQLTITYTHTDDVDEYEKLLQKIDDMINQIDIEEGAEVTTEEIDIFLGKTIDKGCKREGKINGQKAIIIVVAESGNMYLLGYMVKTGFYDQSVWDNFYAQLKLV